MSTRGIVILRKNGEEKSMIIASDAYPEYSARNIVSLIRDVDIEGVFDILIPSSFSDRYWFDARELTLYAEEKREVHYKDNAEFIRDSLMCEYGYVIDIDEEVLEFYVGGQKEPQKGNKYGEKITYTTADRENYYPCKLVAKFSFKYIKSVLLRVIVDKMHQAKESDDVMVFDVDLQDMDNADGAKDEVVVPSLISIYKKLDWIQRTITTTLDKHLDIQNRYEEGLRDITRMKMELSIYRSEISMLQSRIEKMKK